MQEEGGPQGPEAWAPPPPLPHSCTPAVQSTQDQHSPLGPGAVQSPLCKACLPARPAVLLLPFSTGHPPSLTLTFVYTRPISHPPTSQNPLRTLTGPPLDNVLVQPQKWIPILPTLQMRKLRLRGFKVTSRF